MLSYQIIGCQKLTRVFSSRGQLKCQFICIVYSTSFSRGWHLIHFDLLYQLNLQKGRKPHSAGSKPAVGNHTQKHSFNNSTYKQIASSHNNIRTAAQQAHSSTLSVTPLRRRSPQNPHDSSPTTHITDSLTIPTTTQDSLTHSRLESHSGIYIDSLLMYLPII